MSDATLRRRVLDFDPAAHGFPFGNRWRWTEEDLAYLEKRLRPLAGGFVATLPALLGALAGGVTGLWLGAAAGLAAGRLGAGARIVRLAARRAETFGLCGGMAQAAADFWRAGGERPSGPALRACIRARQADTLHASLGRFLRYWLAVRLLPGYRPDAPLRAELAAQLARIRRAIDQERPVTLGLVGDAPNPFSLHQVLCFGYEDTGDGALLHVYDPNAPGARRHIRLELGPALGRRCRIRTDLPAGPRAAGSAHISRTPGRLGFLFTIEPGVPGRS